MLPNFWKCPSSLIYYVPGCFKLLFCNNWIGINKWSIRTDQVELGESENYFSENYIVQEQMLIYCGTNLRKSWFSHGSYM